MYSKKVKGFIAVSTMALFLGGASAIRAQVPPLFVDSDGDGIQDAESQSGRLHICGPHPGDD